MYCICICICCDMYMYMYMYMYMCMCMYMYMYMYMNEAVSKSLATEERERPCQKVGRQGGREAFRYKGCLDQLFV